MVTRAGNAVRPFTIWQYGLLRKVHPSADRLRKILESENALAYSSEDGVKLYCRRFVISQRL